MMLAFAAIDWSSQKQKCVATSSAEAEYIAASEASKEIVWLRVLFAAFNLTQDTPTPLFIDNQSSIVFMKEPNVTPRRKHINVRYNHIRSLIKENFIEPVWVPTAQQLADIFTKPLPRDTFTRMRDLIMGQRE